MASKKPKPVSNQRLWQRAQVAAGKCSLCARKRKSYAVLCDPHQQARRERDAAARAAARKQARRASKLARVKAKVKAAPPAPAA